MEAPSSTNTRLLHLHIVFISTLGQELLGEIIVKSVRMQLSQFENQPIFRLVTILDPDFKHMWCAAYTEPNTSTIALMKAELFHTTPLCDSCL